MGEGVQVLETLTYLLGACAVLLALTGASTAGERIADVRRQAIRGEVESRQESSSGSA